MVVLQMAFGMLWYRAHCIGRRRKTVMRLRRLFVENGGSNTLMPVNDGIVATEKKVQTK